MRTADGRDEQTADLQVPLERNDTAPPRHRVVRSLVLLLCVVAVLGVYTRSAMSYGKTLRGPATAVGFQNLQAEAFAAGQVDLLIDAPPALVELADPFDPVANEPFRGGGGLHDLVLFDGKLYVYNGPAPALILYLPARMLGFATLSSSLACLIFCGAGFVLTVRAFQHAAAFFVGSLGLVTEGVSILALGLAGPMAWLVYVGRSYEVSIACGYFMVAGGLLFLSRALFTRAVHPAFELAVAGTFLGGAVAARVDLIWGLLLLVFALAFVKAGRTPRPIQLHRAAVASVLPVLTIGLGLAWYNWVRFGSPAELGTNYMLTAENVRKAPAGEFSFLARGTFEYLVSPARFGDAFPWFRLRPVSYQFPTEEHYLLEPVAGLLPNMPAVVLGVVAYFIAPWQWLRRHAWLSLYVLTVAIVGLLAFVVVSYYFHGATMRYQMDFAPYLLFASVLGGVSFLARLRGRTWVVLASSVALLVVAYSIFFAVTITTYPCAGTGSC